MVKILFSSWIFIKIIFCMVTMATSMEKFILVKTIWFEYHFMMLWKGYKNFDFFFHKIWKMHFEWYTSALGMEYFKFPRWSYELLHIVFDSYFLRRFVNKWFRKLNRNITHLPSHTPVRTNLSSDTRQESISPAKSYTRPSLPPYPTRTHLSSHTPQTPISPAITHLHPSLQP